MYWKPLPLNLNLKREEILNSILSLFVLFLSLILVQNFPSVRSLVTGVSGSMIILIQNGKPIVIGKVAYSHCIYINIYKHIFIALDSWNHFKNQSIVIRRFRTYTFLIYRSRYHMKVAYSHYTYIYVYNQPRQLASLPQSKHSDPKIRSLSVPSLSI